jgi:hypothetical protein
VTDIDIFECAAMAFVACLAESQGCANIHWWLESTPSANIDLVEVVRCRQSDTEVKNLKSRKYYVGFSNHVVRIYVQEERNVVCFMSDWRTSSTLSSIRRYLQSFLLRTHKIPREVKHRETKVTLFYIDKLSARAMDNV